MFDVAVFNKEVEQISDEMRHLKRIFGAGFSSQRTGPTEEERIKASKAWDEMRGKLVQLSAEFLKNTAGGYEALDILDRVLREVQEKHVPSHVDSSVLKDPDFFRDILAVVTTKTP
jgi:hypothetical protein